MCRRAECVSIAAQVEEELIWFERLRIKTNPTYDPQDLAQRDDLTKLVLEALNDFSPSKVPAPVAQLRDKLKDIGSKDLQSLLALSDTDDQLKQDVSAIVLQSISSSAS